MQIKTAFAKTGVVCAIKTSFKIELYYLKYILTEHTLSSYHNESDNFVHQKGSIAILHKEKQ